MRCDCCGKKRCLFESFEKIKYQPQDLFVCVKCSTTLYKLRDAAKDNDKDQYDKLIQEIESKMTHSTDAFREWQKQFVARNKCKEAD